MKKMEKWEQDQLDQLQTALGKVQLTEAEVKALTWLAGWDGRTVDSFCSIIKKVRAEPKLTE